MVVLRRLVSAAIAMVGLAFAVPASAATHIECVDGGYSAQDTATIQKYLADFKADSFDKQSGGDKLVPIFGARAGECAGKYGWSVDAISDSVFYRMASLLEQGLNAHTPFTPEQMQKLNAALARADKDKLRRIFGPMVEPETSGKNAPAPDEKDSVYLGMLLMSSGLPLDDKTGEFAGALIGARTMKDIFAEKFAGR